MDEPSSKGSNNDGIKSIAHVAAKNKISNLDVLAKKRQWENSKRGALISADASRLYQTSTKINSEIDKRLNNGAQRGNNNRESLQSRLLERITTKNQN